MKRRRLDLELAERGLVRSRSQAAEVVRAGRVRVGRDGPFAVQPSQLVAPDEAIELTEEEPFVSRGGRKLAHALDVSGVDVTGLSCLDVGASTGGFTDCLLSRGAARVIALDVGHGQFDWTLRQDERVTVIERFNARGLEPSVLPHAVELVVVDVSFISLKLLLAPIVSLLAPGERLLAMVKPQFELGRERVGSGGVVRGEDDRREAVRRVALAAAREGFSVRGFAESGVPGPRGNRETFVDLVRDGEEGAVAGSPVEAGIEAMLVEVEV